MVDGVGQGSAVKTYFAQTTGSTDSIGQPQQLFIGLLPSPAVAARETCRRGTSLRRSVLLYVHSDRTDQSGRGADDVHLDFHTAPELWISQ